LLLVFAFWFLSILIYVFNSTSTLIDDFTINGKTFNNLSLNLPEVEITSPKNGDSIYLSSELTIKGTSSDTGDTNCTILISINNIQPFQNASAVDPQEEKDFSNWNSTFFNTTNLVRLGKNTVTSLIICFDTKSNTPTSSSHLINIIGLPTIDNQSILSSVSKVIHDSLENKIVEQHKSSDQSTTLHAKPVHHNNNDRSQSQSQSQSTLSPNSGQSTTEIP